MRNRQRGFSLIVVFLLIVVMVGLAAAVLVSTQGDLQVAGQDREAANAFYAAEAGIAFAKDWLAQQPVGTGKNAWSTVLGSGAQQLCVGGGVAGLKPPTQPGAAQAAVAYDPARTSSYRFCVHNNATDPNYFGTCANPLQGAQTPDGTDCDGTIAVESFGFSADGTASRLYVEIKAPVDVAQQAGDYFQGGGGPLKQAVGEKTNIDQTQKVTF